MEETIWIYIGVISVIIAFGIIFSNFKDFREESKMSKIEWTLAKYTADYNFVCKAAIKTKISSKITLPSGSILNISTNRTCVNLDGDVRCTLLDCSVDKEYILDLNTTMLSRSVSFLDYKCTIERISENVTVVCQG